MRRSCGLRASREPAIADLNENAVGMDREVFAMLRAHAGSAETDACIMGPTGINVG